MLALSIPQGVALGAGPSRGVLSLGKMLLQGLDSMALRAQVWTLQTLGIPYLSILSIPSILNIDIDTEKDCLCSLRKRFLCLEKYGRYGQPQPCPLAPAGSACAHGGA